MNPDEIITENGFPLGYSLGILSGDTRKMLSGFIYMFFVDFRENFDLAINGALDKVFPFSDMAVPALVITIFGYLYTIAIDIKEENDLTIITVARALNKSR